MNIKEFIIKMKCKKLTRALKNLKLDGDIRYSKEFSALKKVMRDIIFYTNKK